VGPGVRCRRRRRSFSEAPPQHGAAASELLKGFSGAALHQAIVADVHSQFPDGSAQWVTKFDAQRLLVATEGDVALARSKLAHAVQWKRGTLNSWLAADNEREVRVIARGHQQRPLCYHCAAHQQWGDVLAANWACCFDKAISSSRDPLAQVDLIVDCTGFSLRMNMSISGWLKLAPSMDSFFAERIHRVIVLDFPGIAEFLWAGIRPLLAPKTANKVIFVSRKDPRSMEKLYELCVDDDMREMVAELLRMNSTADSTTGREASHAFTNGFLERQQQRELQRQEMLQAMGSGSGSAKGRPKGRTM